MIRRQAQLAVEEAHSILFVVDCRAGLTGIDEQVFEILRTAESPVHVVVNKVDSKGQNNEVMEFYSLGVEQLYPVSAEHALGVDDLMEDVVAGLPPRVEEDDDGLPPPP